jgi:hypothetical protein
MECAAADVSVMEWSEPKVVKLKMRGRKLRSGENCQGALNQEAAKQGLRVLTVRPIVKPLAETS